VRPSLARIPASGDARAEAILRRSAGAASRPFVDSLDNGDTLALGRYGALQASIALRTGSAEILRGGLLAAALSQVRAEGDPRDFMVGVALRWQQVQTAEGPDFALA
jgi:hypothetical protein